MINPLRMSLKQMIQSVSLVLFLTIGGANGIQQAHAQWELKEATPKGTIGLGLVGAELGLSIPALAGLNETWSIITFPLVGAAGGAVTGYFVLDKPNHKAPAVAMLATGLTLLIPSIILTVHGMRYDPDDEDDEMASQHPVSSTRTAGLLRFDKDDVALGVPLIWSEQNLTFLEAQKMRIDPRNEYYVALISGTL